MRALLFIIPAIPAFPIRIDPARRTAPAAAGGGGSQRYWNALCNRQRSFKSGNDSASDTKVI